MKKDGSGSKSNSKRKCWLGCVLYLQTMIHFLGCPGGVLVDVDLHITDITVVDGASVCATFICVRGHLDQPELFGDHPQQVHLGPKMYGWPFPIALTMIHMASYATVSFVLVLRVINDSTTPLMMSKLYSTFVVPIGSLYVLPL